ncbi:unnamed protein product [Didymodactylos carnosus]|uniref:PDZ domain-containing protein n=1 Tax=Didymodactylos carnosus TaxID=1234261 RepID=A0A815H7J8_9BILA|nr:unnamed protein product [Didymodactylos carnosus]CAF1348469.1 unnamed protein product [Didymodactylos carnosus]CAF4070073.1 unnamed protein product [Didymodactylos carnosus]CAF4216361.1 unnamed protein product [Didymodactylos carnosus]
MTTTGLRLCRLHVWPNYVAFGFSVRSGDEAPHTIGTIKGGSPASTGGLKDNDVILMINGVDISEEEHETVIDLIFEARDRARTILLLVCELNEYKIERKFDLKNAIKLESPRQSPSTCVSCEKPRQVQCLHCSKFVCLNCAQKHIENVNNQIDDAQNLFNSKTDILDRIHEQTKADIEASFKSNVDKAQEKKNRHYSQLSQMIENKKQMINESSKILMNSPVDKVEQFIRQTTWELNKLNEQESFFQNLEQ